MDLGGKVGLTNRNGCESLEVKSLSTFCRPMIPMRRRKVAIERLAALPPCHARSVYMCCVLSALVL
jgi:hypothetical protein